MKIRAIENLTLRHFSIGNLFPAPVFLFFQFLVIKTLDPDSEPDPHSLQMLDPDPYPDQQKVTSLHILTLNLGQRRPVLCVAWIIFAIILPCTSWSGRIFHWLDTRASACSLQLPVIQKTNGQKNARKTNIIAKYK